MGFGGAPTAMMAVGWRYEAVALLRITLCKKNITLCVSDSSRDEI